MTSLTPRPFQTNISRPIDRGELEGLLAIPPPEDDDWQMSAAAKHSAGSWPSWLRWTIEGHVDFGLLAGLAILVHDLRTNHVLLCPPGTSQAVQQATNYRFSLPDIADEGS